MEPQEPAGWDCGEGKSAEPCVRARTRGGLVGNTHGTVCGRPQVRYPLTGLDAKGVHGLSVGTCLYRLLFLAWQPSHAAASERLFFRHAAPAALDIKQIMPAVRWLCLTKK